MKKRRFNHIQIAAKLRQAEILIGQGKAMLEVCRKLEISQQTYYRWRRKYGGMSPDMIERFMAFELENVQLKKAVG